MSSDDFTPETDDLDDDYADDGDQPARITVKQLRELRRSANRAAKLAKENDGLRKRVAFTDAGLTNLNPVQQRMLLAAVDEPNPEALREAAQAAGWYQPAETQSDEETQQAAQETDAHTTAERAVNGAGSARPNQLTPDEVNGWTADRLFRLNERHPELMEALCRGESVTLPDGF